MKTLKRLSVLSLAILLIFALTACNRDVLQEAVDEINNDPELHGLLEGLYTIRAEKRGDSSIVVIFKAELEELADPDVSEAVAKEGANEFQRAVEEMRKARITDPKVILEFLDLSGILIYTHEFN